VVLVARRLRLPIVAVGIPAPAGLSVLHGLVPPHPGPLVAIDALGANPGLTLLFGLATAIPTVLVAPAGRDGPARALPVDRRLAAADRGDPADRRRR
jgi:GntP family gluconate:H+ symporter